MLDFLTNFLQSFKEKTWLKLLLDKKLLKELKKKMLNTFDYNLLISLEL